MGFDIVGDVHGHADELETLLGKLGYRERSGSWRHPDRHLVFVGDLIDRGPDQMRVVDIARRMRDAGAASICMGNHEFNAIGWMTEDPHQDGHYLTDRNKLAKIKQHEKFLQQVGAYSDRHRELIEWMKTLPLWLEFPGFRVVHACWHQPSMDVLQPHLSIDNTLTEDGIYRLFARCTKEYHAAEIVLKGLEVRLPKGQSFLDKDGNHREHARVQWWTDNARTFRTSALCDERTRDSLPPDALPPEAIIDYDREKPVFFGHYWLEEENPSLVCDMRACLDYSVAKGGHLTAYRWDGEPRLDPAKLVPVCSRSTTETQGTR